LASTKHVTYYEVKQFTKGVSKHRTDLRVQTTGRKCAYYQKCWRPLADKAKITMVHHHSSANDDDGVTRRNDVWAPAVWHRLCVLMWVVRPILAAQRRPQTVQIR